MNSEMKTIEELEPSYYFFDFLGDISRLSPLEALGLFSRQEIPFYHPNLFFPFTNFEVVTRNFLLVTSSKNPMPSECLERNHNTSSSCSIDPTDMRPSIRTCACTW